MAVYEISKLQVRRGLENTTGVPILDSGEFGWASDTESLYIGLRRIDGGSRDANVRILTENDLRNFFYSTSGAGGSGVNVAGTYTFRSATFIATSSTSITYVDQDDKIKRTIQNKLDDIVNIRDFGAKGDNNNDDIGPFQTAVDHLYLFERRDDINIAAEAEQVSTEKILYIPAGTYQISQAIYIPGKTRIVGEGKENTKIIQLSSQSGFFQTIGNNSSPNLRYTFDNPDHDLRIVSPQRPDYVSIENLTLVADKTPTNVATPFIRLDSASHSVIKNVRMIGKWNIPAISYITATHAGIELRGYNSTIFKSENITIENCQFENLHSGVYSRYDVENVNIYNNEFENLAKGVNLNAGGNATDGFSSGGPKLINISNNRFDLIYYEGVYVGPSTQPLFISNIFTRGNQFLDVGNHNNGYNTNIGSAVLKYFSKGNVSSNDYFQRAKEKLANIDTNTATYFPLVSGEVNLTSDITYTKGVNVGQTSTVAIFPITDFGQIIEVRFQEQNYEYDRQGSFTIYVKDGLNPFFYQKEDYHYTIEGPIWQTNTNAEKKFIRLTMYNAPPSGSGFQVRLKVEPFPEYTGFTTVGTYTSLTILASGTNYVVGDVVSINGQLVGGIAIVNDIKIDVLSVNSSGGITSASFQPQIVAANTITTATYIINTSSISRVGGNNSTVDFLHNFSIQSKVNL
jgi:hypothetical protein